MGNDSCSQLHSRQLVESAVQPPTRSLRTAGGRKRSRNGNRSRFASLSYFKSSLMNFQLFHFQLYFSNLNVFSNSFFFQNIFDCISRFSTALGLQQCSRKQNFQWFFHDRFSSVFCE